MKAGPFIFLPAFLALSVLQNAVLSRNPALAADITDPLTRMIGSAKEVIGDMALLKADEYFHGGVEKRFEHHEGDHEKEGIVEEDGLVEPPDWISRVNQAVHVSRHRHLKKDESKELLPFLAIATSLDPYNESAVLTAAYWLEKNFGRADDAIAILEKGAQDIPDSWEIERDLAKLYSKYRMDFQRGETHYRKALSIMEGKDAGVPARVEIWYLLAECLEAQGKRAGAIRAYEGIERLFSDKTPLLFKEKIRKKKEALKAQENPIP